MLAAICDQHLPAEIGAHQNSREVKSDCLRCERYRMKVGKARPLQPVSVVARVESHHRHRQVIDLGRHRCCTACEEDEVQSLNVKEMEAMESSECTSDKSVSVAQTLPYIVVKMRQN